MYLTGGNCVSEKKLKKMPCTIVPTMFFTIKIVNVKIAMALSSKYYAKDRKFRNFCRLIRSMTKETSINLVMIYCIHKGKREATVG